MEYNEFRQSVYKALDNCDDEELKHLENLDGTWYTLVFDEMRSLNGGYTTKIMKVRYANERNKTCDSIR